MRMLQFLCFNIVMLPFYIIGFIMHLCLLGYELVGPFMASLLLPQEVKEAIKNGKVIPVSRQEAEAYVNDYLEKNPDATAEDALKAFVQEKQRKSNG